MKPSSLAAVALAVCVGVVNIRGAAGLSTAFTYQGQLLQSGGPVNGSCDLQFELFDAASGGNQVGTTQTASGVSIANGLFTVSLDFGSQFSGADRWLQIALRCPAGVGSFSAPLTPREQLTATPYALFAPVAGSANGLSCSGCVTGSAIASSTIPASSLAFTPGTVTSITAGAGLSGGTITGSGTISNSGVLSVGASAPLSSSAGQNPTVSLSGTVAVANGGTGASDAAGARRNLIAAESGFNYDIWWLGGGQ